MFPYIVISWLAAIILILTIGLAISYARGEWDEDDKSHPFADDVMMGERKDNETD